MTEQTMSPSRLSRLGRLSLFAVAVIALWSTLRTADLRGAAQAALGIGPWAFIILIPALLSFVAHGAAYQRIFAALGAGEGRPPPLGRILAVVISAEAVLMSAPAGTAVVETVKPYLFHRRCGVPVPMGLAAAASKRALIWLANAAYVGIAVALGAPYLRRASRALLGVGGLDWLVGAAGAFMLAASLFAVWALGSGSVAARSHGLLRRLPSARLRAWVERLRGGFSAVDGHLSGALGARRDLAAAAALLLGCWLLEAVEAAVILRLLGVSMPFGEVLAFEVVISLLRSIAFVVPAGLGIQDAGYVAFLSAFGVPAPAATAVAFVLLKRAKELFWILAGLGLFAALGDGQGLGARRAAAGEQG